MPIKVNLTKEQREKLMADFNKYVEDLKKSGAAFWVHSPTHQTWDSYLKSRKTFKGHPLGSFGVDPAESYQDEYIEFTGPLDGSLYAEPALQKRIMPTNKQFGTHLYKTFYPGPCRAADLEGHVNYRTSFQGYFVINGNLKYDHGNYLARFCEVVHVKRDVTLLEKEDDDIRKIVGLPLGKEGAYYTGADKARSDLFIDEPPEGVPGVLCHWQLRRLPKSGQWVIQWNLQHHFYDAQEWLEYLIVHFLDTWGYTVSGTCHWVGEDNQDQGYLIVINNEVTVSNTSP